ncbi:MAG: hypothetical protein LQ344_005802 [Seirophora lacunosa]|nr:MAG: hypothetical protein LQ344_005802 [Seirophora lacunosa]
MPSIGRSLSAALRAFAHPDETYDLKSRARRAERSASHAADAYRTEQARRMHAQREAALVGYRVGYGEGAGDTRDRARRSREVGYRRGYDTRAVEDRERVDDGEFPHPPAFSSPWYQGLIGILAFHDGLREGLGTVARSNIRQRRQQQEQRSRGGRGEGGSRHTGPPSSGNPGRQRLAVEDVPGRAPPQQPSRSRGQQRRGNPAPKKGNPDSRRRRGGPPPRRGY